MAINDKMNVYIRRLQCTHFLGGIHLKTMSTQDKDLVENIGSPLRTSLRVGCVATISYILSLGVWGSGIKRTFVFYFLKLICNRSYVPCTITVTTHSPSIGTLRRSRLVTGFQYDKCPCLSTTLQKYSQSKWDT